MPPHAEDIRSDILEEQNGPLPSSEKEKKKSRIVWRNLIIFIIFHIGGVYGIYIVLFKAKWLTFFFDYFLLYFTGLSITAGAHRLWSHKTFKARLPLKIFLITFQTMSLEGPLINWVRDHRMHHKYTETDADPHNAKRGFFFSHIGWMLVRKHPDIIAKGHAIDVSDVTNDPVPRFQKRYYAILAPLTCVVIPTLIPTLWGESLLYAFLTCALQRCVVIWHFTYLVNSWAHLWGDRPYDKNINPVDSKVLTYLTIGEANHNYHHTFPFDYKAAETSGILFHSTTVFIDAMAKIGLAYDLKTVSSEVVKKRAERTGDGSRSAYVWNYEDGSFEDKKATVIQN